MKKEDLKITDENKMRLHYRKRSGKRTENSVEIDSVPDRSYRLIDYNDATDEEKKMYDDAMDGLSSEGSDRIAVTKTSRGRNVIIDPERESERKKILKQDSFIVKLLLVTAVICIVITLVSFFQNSKTGNDIKLALNRSAYISDEGYYKFGSFDGYVTIGDSFDKALTVLGLPEISPTSNSQYLYGSSYILVENDIVVGYHKDRSDLFKVTVGYKVAGVKSDIYLGDSAGLVVQKLGSPDTYLKYKWIYENMNFNFMRDNYTSQDTKDLIVLFDEDYNVKGYEFVSAY